MKKGWKMVKLGEVLRPIKNSVDLDPSCIYKQVTIRLNRKGVVQRGLIQGSQIGSKQYLASENQFIISKIDARNGAYGVVPQELDGAIVTGDFLLFDTTEAVEVSFLNLYANTRYFDLECKKASEGTTNRVRLKVDKFLQIPFPLPPLAEQRRIAAYLDGLREKVEAVRRLREEQERIGKNLLHSLFSDLIKGAEWRKMGEVAPIVRREVEVLQDGIYPELGIRSFGKGTFHKPALNGVEVGTKRLFQIKERDLIFSNVFAWEGAIAVVKNEDNDRFGSHRFITCVCKEDLALPEFLCFYLLTEEGLEKVNKASPGGAGRNKTLGIKKLELIEVPIPRLSVQREFIAIQEKLTSMQRHQVEQMERLSGLMPGVLEGVFGGE